MNGREYGDPETCTTRVTGLKRDVTGLKRDVTTKRECKVGFTMEKIRPKKLKNRHNP